MTNLEFFDGFYIADCAANLLFDRRTARHPGSDPETRSILRKSAVETLRRLWATGDPKIRKTVIARVMVWCCYKHDWTDPDGCRARHNARINAVIKRLGL